MIDLTPEQARKAWSDSQYRKMAEVAEKKGMLFSHNAVGCGHFGCLAVYVGQNWDWLWFRLALHEIVRGH